MVVRQFRPSLSGLSNPEPPQKLDAGEKLRPLLSLPGRVHGENSELQKTILV
jgi:hypothetical protein